MTLKHVDKSWDVNIGMTLCVLLLNIQLNNKYSLLLNIAW